MPAYFDKLRPASFSGIVFMAERIKVLSNGRQHIHEFPHAAGGAPEKLGRGLYYISVQANFQTTFAAYPNLYPNAMLSLRRLYEAQITATFVHPTSGEFDAFISKWDQDYEPGRIRSGEKVQIDFIEDQRSIFLTQASADASSTQMAMAQSNIDAGIKALQDTLRMTPTDLSVFDAVRSAVNTILSLQSTVSIYSQILNAKAQELVSNCQQADQLFPMQSPLAFPILDPLWEVQANAQKLASVTSTAGLSSWFVPRTMSLLELSQTLYMGDASRQEYLLALNAQNITNPFAIEAGTEILYVPSVVKAA